MTKLTTTQEARTSAIERFARGYAEQTGRNEFVNSLLQMRTRALALEDPQSVVLEVLRLLDTRNNDASTAIEHMQAAILEDNWTCATDSLLEMALAFGDENLSLTVRFELEGTPEGMFGCMNDAQGWVFAHSVLKLLLPTVATRTYDEVKRIFALMPRQCMEDFAGIKRIPLDPPTE